MDAYKVEICENKTFQAYFLYLKDIKEEYGLEIYLNL